MTRKQRRLTMIGGSLAVLAVAAALVLNAMRDSIVFFSTPTMAAEKHIPPGKRFRLGGLVQPGSLVRGDNLAVTFAVADGGATLPVAYKGILPDLFREGQGVVAEGALDAAGVFKADTVLAKHDETYMPKDVADALKKQGHWKDDYGAKPSASAAPQGSAAPTQGSNAVIAEAGHYALVLALALALIQSTVPIAGARWDDAALMNVARSTALAQLAFAAASFAALVWLHVTSDFSVANVFENSHSLKPLIYKITGVWGNHEGSMLLWVSILALFGGLVAAFGNNLPLSLRAHVLAVQAWIASAFYLFILITSNPFLRIANPPIEGRDLNPVLQDIGLAVHPPMLYLGYVGFSISFSFAIAALLEGRIDAAWARWVRPWTLVAWIFLTLGIAMGSYWAYYELGWGGWWFWDPVENASLMPWLAGTALLHSAVVMEKRNALKVWTILLSILTFSLSLLGTFLVRSGVLTSVHAFATDPARGVFILLILCLFIGGGLSLYAWRASALKQGGLFAPISREGALVLNNLFLTTACATVFIGTLYPLALEVLTGDKISVGAPFFNLTFAPLFVPLMIAVPFGPLLAWKRGDLVGASQRLMAAGIAALIAIAVLFAWIHGGSTFAPLAIGLAVWVIVGAMCDLAERIGLFRVGFGIAARRARGLPRATWGTAFAHAGVGVALIGIVCETTWNSEYIATMKPNDVAMVAGYELKLDGLNQRQGPNFREMIAQFTVNLDGQKLSVMTPSKRNFTTRGSATTEAALLTRGASQLYISLGDSTADGAIAVRIYHKPMVLLIWWGPVLMAFGGMLSLSDRRLRVGAPKPAKASRALQPAE